MHITIKISIILFAIAGAGFLSSFIINTYSHVDWECEEKVKDHIEALHTMTDLAYESPFEFALSPVGIKSQTLSEYITEETCVDFITHSTYSQYYDIRAEIESIAQRSDYYDYAMFYHEDFTLIDGCFAGYPYLRSDGDCWTSPEPLRLNWDIDPNCPTDKPYRLSNGVCNELPDLVDP